ncbi:MAG: hypothetical protein P0S95_01465 [Rhabdochlamydiaceae bacterium]|nr:hypothetical protein [Candidatus Amphrikana amoebophyrae]
MESKLQLTGFELAHQISALEREIDVRPISPSQIDTLFQNLNCALLRDPTSLILLQQQERAISLAGRVNQLGFDREINSICDRAQTLVAKKHLVLEERKEAAAIFSAAETLSHNYRGSLEDSKRLAKVKKDLTLLGFGDSLVDTKAVEPDQPLASQKAKESALVLMEMGSTLFHSHPNHFFEIFNSLDGEAKDLLQAHIDRRGCSLTMLNSSSISPLHIENSKALMQAVMRCAHHLAQGEDIMMYPSHEEIEALFSEAQEIEELSP